MGRRNMESECKKKENVEPPLLSFTGIKSFIMACIRNNKNYYVQIKSCELD